MNASSQNASNGDDEVEKIASAVRTILENIQGEDPDRNGLAETPGRVARSLSFLTQGYGESPHEVVGNAIFEEPHEGMVVVRDLDIYSYCEHHIIPFFGKAHIAYIPDKNCGVVGLSKLARLTQVYSRRLQVQERLGTQIMQAINEVLTPKGVGVILECRHMCMEMRGVQMASATTVTKAMCGVFTDPSTQTEFYNALALRCNHQESGFVDSTQQSHPASCCVNGGVIPSNKQQNESQASLQSFQAAVPILEQNNASDYRLYVTCAGEELDAISRVIKEALTGPLICKAGGLSLLDIGAGNGRLLDVLCSNHLPTQSITRYSAFEEDQELCGELATVALSTLGLDDNNSTAQARTFGVDTTVEEAGGSADVVLLSHSLYGASSKIDIVLHALKFVAVGGIMLVFHRSEQRRTLDDLCRDLTSRSILHHVRIFDVEIDVSSLNADQRLRMAHYTKQPLGSTTTRIKHTVGCIGIEAHSCQLGTKAHSLAVADSVVSRVCYAAHQREPVGVIVPNSVVGIQASIQAANLAPFPFGRITVVGGGHSKNCLADSALAIDMALWNTVTVDTMKLTVKVGGGATVGEITRECEKHGLAVPLGDRPGVGMGLVLQGGISHMMRKYGLASDNILRVEYVSPTGHLWVADSADDLFRFRGAGTNFGVVLEVTLRAYKVESVWAQDTDYQLGDHRDGPRIAESYSDTADSLPASACLDAYFYWSGPEKQSFATTLFSVDTKLASNILDHCCETTDVIQGEPKSHSMSGLFDRELYMTDAFDPKQVVPVGASPPRKLRSLKCCLFLPLLDSALGSLLSDSVGTAPTKWCYIHLLHGGEAVSKLDPEQTAFGCRGWKFAAVITGRFEDGSHEMERNVTRWVDETMQSLQPFSLGVYAADIGPEDADLAVRAFGPNYFRLANLKRQHDPLNVLGCGCPLTGGDALQTRSCGDPRSQSRGIVVIFCGKRFVGKDWLAGVAEQCLREIIDDHTKDNVTTAQISDVTKRAYAAANPSVDADRLIHDHKYKDGHRKDLKVFYKKQRAQTTAYDAKCYLDAIQKSAPASILLLTGMRDGLEYARSLAGRAVVLIKVNATDETRASRGWSFDAWVDESAGECYAAAQAPSFWDLKYDNNHDIGGTSTTTSLQSAQAWVKSTLAPLILQYWTRQLPDTPQPGIVYKDLVGGILLQPCGLALFTGLFLDHIKSINGSSCNSFDVIVAPEALGFVFASPLAATLNKPLVLVRKKGKLAGDVNTVRYRGSNMGNLMMEGSTTQAYDCDGVKSSLFEVVCGSLEPGQRALVVDDCLATGSTLEALAGLVTLQGAAIVKLLCVMELFDLNGRAEVSDKLGIEVFSLLRFPGK